MQTKVITIYAVEELTGSAKERALEWLREGATDYNWYTFIFEDAKKRASILGIEIDDIYFSGFYHQGSGACFSGSFSYVKGWKKTFLDYAPIDTELLRIGQELQAIQKPFMYQITGAIESNDRYYRTSCGSADINGRVADVPDSVIDDLTECFADFASWIYKNLQTEYELLMSEEQLTENAKANGYAFDSEGRII